MDTAMQAFAMGKLGQKDRSNIVEGLCWRQLGARGAVHDVGLIHGNTLGSCKAEVSPGSQHRAILDCGCHQSFAGIWAKAAVPAPLLVARWLLGNNTEKEAVLLALRPPQTPPHKPAY